MEEYTWRGFVLLVVVNLASLYVGITTKPGPKNNKDMGYIFRRYARTVGLMIGIGGWIPAIRLLFILLERRQ